MTATSGRAEQIAASASLPLPAAATSSSSGRDLIARTTASR
jgi:hypothetical protein